MKLILLFFPLLVSLVTRAQSIDTTIRGLVKDELNEPLPGATVILYRAADSTLVRGETTQSNGKFAFTGLTSNVYYLRVTSVGMKEYRSGSLTIDEAHPVLALPAILLSPSRTTLQEVKVVAKRPLVEQEIDKTVVNVDALIGSAGNNTLEVLEKTPGVTVGTDGEISLNGKNGVLVLIDGRQTYLSGPDLAAYLRSLPGGSLDKLELMTNPPAKYDAAGTAIINIRLKRNRVQGFTGDVSASYSQGRTVRSNEVINLNFNRKKLNVFGGLSYNKDGDYADNFYNRTFYGENGALISSLRLQNNFRTSSQGLTGRLGMDYAVSPKTTYGFVVSMQSRPRREWRDITSQNFNASSLIDSVGVGGTNGNFSWKNKSANVNYNHRFDQAGREITADLSYAQYESDGVQRLTNVMVLPDGTPLNHSEFLFNLPSDIQIYTAKADYVHPLKNKFLLEAGIKSSLVNTDNDSKYYTVIDHNKVPDYGKSNHFIYRENINAAYVNTRKEWKLLGIQAGLRVENTLANGRQLGNAEVQASSFDKNYTRFFPTVFVRYKLDTVGKNTVSLSLARRINRANYQLLNPFVFLRDTYSYTAGNPFLNPQYHYQYELKYQHKTHLGIALQYNRFTDVIFQLTETVGDLFITSPRNVAKGYILSLATNLSLEPTKWWRLNANLMGARMALQGTAYTEKLTPGIFHARLNAVNQFQLKKGWSGELIGFFATKDLAGQTITEPRYRVSFAVQKKMLKGKGSLRFMADDLFHSWRQNDRTVSLKQAVAYHTGISDTRRVGLAFTYRFGKETFARKRRHTDNAADAEKGRVD
ncbi:outer membrane beta-barrel protein [Larkinella insperata]|uniref:Outer membrane beta-barrel protein n=1 Tax=Larkinella insperata TaxID=332158 RepID=A0ABW3Q3M5_9BACT|nr:TonB-dependent receptor [Larkinella insperata]